MSRRHPVMTIKLLGFDLDDTLWPCMPTILAAERIHYQWLQNNVPRLCQHYDARQLMEKRQGFLSAHPELAHDLSLARRRFLAAVAEELSIPGDWVDEAFAVFYRARQKVCLYDDVKPVLDKLSASYTLVALSNGNADIAATGVAHWFDFSLCAADVGIRKSSPRIYQQARRRVNCQPQQAIHIGDDPRQDVFGARAAGWKTVWLNRQGRDWPERTFSPDREIRRLDELPAVIASLA